MGGFDLVLEKNITKLELHNALAKTFNIKDENIVIDVDYDASPFVGDIKLWVIINEYHGGDFLLNCALYIRDNNLECNPIILSKRLCHILNSACLIADDSPSPLTWIMISPDGSEKAIILDSNALDNDQYVIAQITH